MQSIPSFPLLLGFNSLPSYLVPTYPLLTKFLSTYLLLLIKFLSKSLISLVHIRASEYCNQLCIILFGSAFFFITNASSQLSLQKTTISIGISTRQSDSLTSFKCKERERERDCVNFCTHCSSSTLWFPCQRFKTFFGCQEMDL